MHPPIRKLVKNEFDIKLGSFVNAKFVPEPQANAMLEDVVNTSFEPSSWSSIVRTVGVANKNVISHEHRGPIFCQPFDLETGSYVSVDEVKT